MRPLAVAMALTFIAGAWKLNAATVALPASHDATIFENNPDHASARARRLVPRAAQCARIDVDKSGRGSISASSCAGAPRIAAEPRVAVAPRAPSQSDPSQPAK